MPPDPSVAGCSVALSVGSLVFQILTDIQERYQAMAGRMQRVAELNHHVRNAIQVIVYHNVPGVSERAIQEVNSALIRIESVLREVSPLPAGRDQSSDLQS